MLVMVPGSQTAQTPSVPLQGGDPRPCESPGERAGQGCEQRGPLRLDPPPHPPTADPQDIACTRPDGARGREGCRAFLLGRQVQGSEFLRVPLHV